MEIIAGMILICTMVTHFDHGTYNLYIKDVETKVHHIAPTGSTLIQYNLRNNKNIIYNGTEELFDIVNIEDLKRKSYMNCRKKGKQ